MCCRPCKKQQNVILQKCRQRRVFPVSLGCAYHKTASLLSSVKEILMYDTLFTANTDTYRVQQRHTLFLLFSITHFTSISLFKTLVSCLAVNYLHRQRPSKAASWLKWILIRDWSEMLFIGTNSVNCHKRDPHMKHMRDLTKRQLIPIELDISISL